MPDHLLGGWERDYCPVGHTRAQGYTGHCPVGHTRAQGYTGHSVQWATQGPRATLDTLFNGPHKGPGLHWTLCSIGHTRAQGYTGHCPVGHTRAQGYTGHSVQWATQGPRATLDTLFQGGSVKVTCVRKMADAAALYCVFYLY